MTEPEDKKEPDEPVKEPVTEPAKEPEGQEGARRALARLGRDEPGRHMAASLCEGHERAGAREGDDICSLSDPHICSLSDPHICSGVAM